MKRLPFFSYHNYQRYWTCWNFQLFSFTPLPSFLGPSSILVFLHFECVFLKRLPSNLEWDFYENSKEKTEFEYSKADANAFTVSHVKIELQSCFTLRFYLILFFSLVCLFDWTQHMHMHFCRPELLISWRELTFDIAQPRRRWIQTQVENWNKAMRYEWNQHNMCHDCNIYDVRMHDAERWRERWSTWQNEHWCT